MLCLLFHLVLFPWYNISVLSVEYNDVTLCDLPRPSFREIIQMQWYARVCVISHFLDHSSFPVLTACMYMCISV